MYPNEFKFFDTKKRRFFILFKIGNTQRLVMSGQNMFYALEPNFCHFSHSPNIYLCSTLDTGYQIFKTKVSRKFISVFCDLSSESNRLLQSDRFRCGIIWSRHQNWIRMFVFVFVFAFVFVFVFSLSKYLVTSPE